MDQITITAILTALLQGFLFAISPCVLSVLPIILSSSLGGGHKRPLGIIIGLMSSFAIFSILLIHTISSLGISPELIRFIALVCIVFFALSMIFSFLENKFEHISIFVSNIGNSLYQKLNKKFALRSTDEQSSGGLLSGILLGICLGLIWTPCVGPLVGGTIAQASTQTSIFANLSVIFAFCVGAGLPMLLLAVFSRHLTLQIKFFKQNAVLLRQIAGSFILITALAGSGQSLLLAKHWVQSEIFGQEVPVSEQMLLFKTTCHIKM